MLVARYNLAQVSINLTDYEVTGMEMAYEEIKKDATALNLDVCGSEIVSLLYPSFTPVGGFDSFECSSPSG